MLSWPACNNFYKKSKSFGVQLCIPTMLLRLTYNLQKLFSTPQALCNFVVGIQCIVYEVRISPSINVGWTPLASVRNTDITQHCAGRGVRMI